MWVKLLDAFLDSFRYDLVGDAAERLQTDDVCDALLRISDNFSREQPSFAKLGIERDDVPGSFRFFKDVFERDEVAELAGQEFTFLICLRMAW